MTDDPLVGADIVGRPEAAVVELPSIEVREMGRRCLVRLLAWFDPVTAAAARLTELVDSMFEEQGDQPPASSCSFLRHR